LHQLVAREAFHQLVRFSAALCAAEKRQARTVQDVSIEIAYFLLKNLRMKSFNKKYYYPSGEFCIGSILGTMQAGS
jgi:hypothetical protein